ncbi:peptide deformylase [Stenotrophomonas phage vB_SmaS-DLP_6]|nr:peptide deformylase [Stenotrophomonas phage vB_SmaS-DLP_6]
MSEPSDYGVPTPPQLQLVADDHPLLSQKLEEFDFSNPPTDPIQLAQQLAELMVRSRGVGLSANQAGLPYRVFVLASNPITACFNPRIVDQGDELLQLDEGCLSYPGLAIKIKRPKNIKVRYTLPNGEVVTQKFSGITARIFQHELDHMNGENFINRAGPLAKQRAMEKWKKTKRLLNLKNKMGIK